MKLLLVTSLKEYQKTVADIFNTSGIAVFSVTETKGFKDHYKPNLLDNWFSNGADQFDSIFVFSFTEESRAEHAMQLIRDYNESSNTDFPVRGFIIPVDKSSYVS